MILLSLLSRTDCRRALTFLLLSFLPEVIGGGGEVPESLVGILSMAGILVAVFYGSPIKSPVFARGYKACFSSCSWKQCGDSASTCPQ